MSDLLASFQRASHPEQIAWVIVLAIVAVNVFLAAAIVVPMLWAEAGDCIRAIRHGAIFPDGHEDRQPTGYFVGGGEIHLPPAVPMDRENFRQGHAASVVPFVRSRRTV